jgi:hypothetical protein
MKQVVKGKKVALKVFARCNEPCTVKVTGRIHFRQRVVRNGRASFRAKTISIPARSVKVKKANQKATVKLRLNTSKSKRLIRLMGQRRNRSFVAKTKAVATDTAGNRAKAVKRSIRLTRPRGKR